MQTIKPRVPDIQWSEQFERHWLSRCPVRTHTFNALSFLFPQAELFFIQIVREVMGSLEDRLPASLRQSVNAFVTQEANHTALHKKYNTILEAMGFRNVTYGFVNFLQKESQNRFSSLTRLAIVCGYEHYTAILGNFILSNPQVLAKAESKMALVWGWHSAEETEHKSVCFDLYQAAGGGWLRRVAAFFLVTINFNLMFFRLYLHMLAHDQCFKRGRLWRTLSESARFFFGKHGVGWDLIRYGVGYLSPTFHPWQQDNRDKLTRWLALHESQLRAMA